jgi:hypothetical protein
MPIKRYYPTKDTTITDAYDAFLSKRKTDANMGESDSLEIFSIFGNASSGSVEKSRILIDFNKDSILSEINTLKQDGNVKYYLRMFNVVHPYSLPEKFTVSVNLLSRSWDEGHGLDMESYLDKGWPTGNGATWLYATKTDEWVTEGGDILTGYEKTQYFELGSENLEIDITDLVVSGTLSASYGFLVSLTGSQESGADNQSYYTKKFSARGTQYFYSKPIIEARWESGIFDDRNNFYAYNPMVSTQDNTMKLYHYNRVNGVLKDIPGTPSLSIKFYTDQDLTQEISPTYSASANPETGIYTFDVILNTTASVVYDVWKTGSYVVSSDSFTVYRREDNLDEVQYLLKITNLKPTYSTSEKARFNLFIRENDWNPNIYSKVFSTTQNNIITNLYYKISRPYDNYIVLDYSTGSVGYTKTSYDANGNYFELDMSILEKSYPYNIQFATWNGQELKELPEIFKFRVE